MTNTKRLGRYHRITNNNNNDSSTSPSCFNYSPSLYKDNSRKPLLDWDNPVFGSKSSSLQKLLAKTNKTTERATKFINKIKSRQLACVHRAKSVPENATIRKEYIKCGKQMCGLDHGPYYYAYWKDPECKKLKKKYIGDHMPKNKESVNDYNNGNNTL